MHLTVFRQILINGLLTMSIVHDIPTLLDRFEVPLSPYKISCWNYKYFTGEACFGIYVSSCFVLGLRGSRTHIYPFLFISPFMFYSEIFVSLDIYLFPLPLYQQTSGTERKETDTWGFCEIVSKRLVSHQGPGCSRSKPSNDFYVLEPRVGLDDLIIYVK